MHRIAQPEPEQITQRRRHDVRARLLRRRAHDHAGRTAAGHQVAQQLGELLLDRLLRHGQVERQLVADDQVQRQPVAAADLPLPARQQLAIALLHLGPDRTQQLERLLAVRAGDPLQRPAPTPPARRACRRAARSARPDRAPPRQAPSTARPTCRRPARRRSARCARPARSPPARPARRCRPGSAPTATARRASAAGHLAGSAPSNGSRRDDQHAAPAPRPADRAAPAPPEHADTPPGARAEHRARRPTAHDEPARAAHRRPAREPPTTRPDTGTDQPRRPSRSSPAPTPAERSSRAAAAAAAARAGANRQHAPRSRPPRRATADVAERPSRPTRWIATSTSTRTSSTRTLHSAHSTPTSSASSSTRARSRRCARASSSTTCTTDDRRHMRSTYAAAFSAARPFGDAAGDPDHLDAIRAERDARALVHRPRHRHQPLELEHRALPDPRITRRLDRDDLRAVRIERDDLQVVEQLAVLVGLVLPRLEVRDRASLRRGHERHARGIDRQPHDGPRLVVDLTDTRPPSQSEHDEFVSNGSD